MVGLVHVVLAGPVLVADAPAAAVVVCIPGLSAVVACLDAGSDLARHKGSEAAARHREADSVAGVDYGRAEKMIAAGRRRVGADSVAVAVAVAVRAGRRAEEDMPDLREAARSIAVIDLTVSSQEEHR